MNDGSKEPQEQDNHTTLSAKKMIDFELLWRCISKIWNESNRQGNNKNKILLIIYIRGTVEFCMFIIVSMTTPL